MLGREDQGDQGDQEEDQGEEESHTAGLLSGLLSVSSAGWDSPVCSGSDLHCCPEPPVRNTVRSSGTGFACKHFL